MSTRAQVAYIDEDMTSIVTTYNHYDGYPESLGKALLNHYDSDSKAYEIELEVMKHFSDTLAIGGRVLRHDAKPASSYNSDWTETGIFVRRSF